MCVCVIYARVSLYMDTNACCKTCFWAQLHTTRLYTVIVITWLKAGPHGEVCCNRLETHTHTLLHSMCWLTLLIGLLKTVHHGTLITRSEEAGEISSLLRSYLARISHHYGLHQSSVRLERLAHHHHHINSSNNSNSILLQLLWLFIFLFYLKSSYSVAKNLQPPALHYSF